MNMVGVRRISRKITEKKNKRGRRGIFYANNMTEKNRISKCRITPKDGENNRNYPERKYALYRHIYIYNI